MPVKAKKEKKDKDAAGKEKKEKEKQDKKRHRKQRSASSGSSSNRCSSSSRSKRKKKKRKDKEKEKEKEKEKSLAAAGAFARRSVHRKEPEKEKEKEKEKRPDPPSFSLSPAPARTSHDGPPPVALESIQHKHLGGALLIHRERQGSSRFNAPVAPQLEKLPLLRETKLSERGEMFLKKIRQCCAIFDFENALGDIRSKEVKRACLAELYDYIKNNHGVLTEAAHVELITMFSENAFRVLSPPSSINGADFDPEEDEPVLEPAWGHLQLVYELFSALLESPEFQPNFAKRQMDQSFVCKLLELFDSEDPRERDLLKTILHRVYGKMLALRVHIRRFINNVFFRFIYELPGKHNGIAELLEILGSVINGFALPLKDEHKSFLLKVLLPLHKAKSLGPYHPQLAYCIVQFLEKDRALAGPVLRALFHVWPRTNSSKEVMLLNELEEIVDMMQAHEFDDIHTEFFHQLSRCIASPHFQVAERALYFWNNDHILQLMQEYSDECIPLLFPALSRNIKAHWNRNIHTLIYSALKTLMDIDPQVFETCSTRLKQETVTEKQRLQVREAKWRQLEQLAEQNPSCRVVPVSRVFKHSVHDALAAASVEDTVAELRRVTVEPENVQPSGRMRRKSVLPQDQDVQQALLAHRPHGVGLGNTGD